MEVFFCKPSLCQGKEVSLNWPKWANSVIELPFPSVVLCVCLHHRMQYYESQLLPVILIALIPVPLEKQCCLGGGGGCVELTDEEAAKDTDCSLK